MQICDQQGSDKGWLKVGESRVYLKYEFYKEYQVVSTESYQLSFKTGNDRMFKLEIKIQLIKVLVSFRLPNQRYTNANWRY